jgi:hypothetical protein
LSVITFIITTYVSELSKVRLDLIVADFGNQSTDEDLSSACLGLLGVNLLVVNDVITGSDNFVDGIGDLVDDEGEASRTSSGGICLNVDALNLSVLSEVIAKFLC